MAGAETRLAERIGVSPREMGALALAYTSGGAGIGDVRRHLGLSAAATTELVDRLEGTGHVIRARSPLDRREVRVTISDATSAAIGEALEPLLADLRALVEALDLDERRVVDRFLTAATDRYRAFARTAQPSKELV